MRIIDADKISFRCAYNGDCMADEEKCKKCPDYVCDFEEIQSQPTIDDKMENVSDLQFLEELLQECRGKLGIGSRYGIQYIK